MATEIDFGLQREQEDWRHKINLKNLEIDSVVREIIELGVDYHAIPEYDDDLFMDDSIIAAATGTSSADGSGSNSNNGSYDLDSDDFNLDMFLDPGYYANVMFYRSGAAAGTKKGSVLASSPSSATTTATAPLANSSSTVVVNAQQAASVSALATTTTTPSYSTPSSATTTITATTTAPTLAAVVVKTDPGAVSAVTSNSTTIPPSTPHNRTLPKGKTPYPLHPNSAAPSHPHPNAISNSSAYTHHYASPAYPPHSSSHAHASASNGVPHARTPHHSYPYNHKSGSVVNASSSSSASASPSSISTSSESATIRDHSSNNNTNSNTHNTSASDHHNALLDSSNSNSGDSELNDYDHLDNLEMLDDLETEVSWSITAHQYNYNYNPHEIEHFADTERAFVSGSEHTALEFPKVVVPPPAFEDSHAQAAPAVPTSSAPLPPPLPMPPSHSTGAPSAAAPTPAPLSPHPDKSNHHHHHRELTTNDFVCLIVRALEEHQPWSSQAILRHLLQQPDGAIQLSNKLNYESLKKKIQSTLGHKLYKDIFMKIPQQSSCAALWQLREDYKSAMLAAGVDMDDTSLAEHQHRTIEHNEHIFSPSNTASPSGPRASSPASSNSTPLSTDARRPLASSNEDVATSSALAAPSTPTKQPTAANAAPFPAGDFPETSSSSPAKAHLKLALHASRQSNGTAMDDEDIEWESDGNENGGENPERDDEREDEHDSSSSSQGSDDSDEEIDVLDIGDASSLPSTGVADLLLANVPHLHHRKEKLRHRGHKRLNEESWNDHFDELIKFQRNHSHFAVPTKGEYEKLYQWIKRQRAAKRNNKASLTPDRIKKLNDIGFPWQPDRKRTKTESSSSSNIVIAENPDPVIVHHTTSSLGTSLTTVNVSNSPSHHVMPVASATNGHPTLHSRPMMHGVDSRIPAPHPDSHPSMSTTAPMHPSAAPPAPGMWQHIKCEQCALAMQMESQAHHGTNPIPSNASHHLPATTGTSNNHHQQQPGIVAIAPPTSPEEEDYEMEDWMEGSVPASTPPMMGSPFTPIPAPSPTATTAKTKKRARDPASPAGDAADDGTGGVAHHNRLNGERWDERFAELIQFYQETGHCKVPRKGFPELNRWIHKQLFYYRQKSGAMTQDRYNKLQTVGFWDTYK